MAVAALGIFAYKVDKYYFLGDDCFISFRYARNLAEGLGLVWNPGEPVEGYTNFLWVLFMAGGMLLGILPEILSNVIGIASGVLLLVVLLHFYARRIGWRNPFAWFPPLLLAANMSFAGWSTGGLGTQFFSLMVFLGYVVYIRERDTAEPYPWRSSVIFSIAALTRPEGIMFMGIAGVLFLVEVWLRRRKPVSLIVWVLPFVAIIGTHFIWRRWYYGFWLPNTFYAKVTDVLLGRSVKYFSYFHQQYRVGWFLPLLAIPPAFKRDFVSVLFFAVVAAHFSYVFRIGGDHFGFRFLVVAMPYFYWLMVEALRFIWGLRQGGFRRRTALVSLVGGIALALFVTTLTGRTFRSTRYRGGEVSKIPIIRNHAKRRAWEGKTLRSLVDKGILPDDIVISVQAAGALPYYTRWVTVDYFGLNDVNIARSKVRRRFWGHDRKASLEYLRQRKVAIFDKANSIIYEELPQTIYRGKGTGTWKCLKAGEHYLWFVTFLSKAEFESTFSNVEIIY
jgi:hypothetical protein